MIEPEKASCSGSVCCIKLGRLLLAFLLLTLLTACEAPLILNAVESEGKAPIRRTDMFQAAAGNGQAAVVVAGMGVVVSSSDAGTNWSRQVIDGKPFLIDVAACPNGSFIILDVSHRLWLSDSKATQWRSIPIDTQEALQAITCDQKGQYWVVGGFSSILNSADEGKSWNSFSMDEDLHFTSIQFVDDQNGFVSGEFGAMARTEDGGETWERLPSLDNDFYPQDIFFESKENGWIVGLSGTILATQDGGQSWQREESGTDVPLYSITPGKEALYIVGGNGVVLSQKNGQGGQWQAVAHGKPIRFYLRALHAVEGDELLVGGGFGALYRISG